MTKQPNDDVQLDDVLRTPELDQQARRPDQRRWTDVDLPLLALSKASRAIRLASIARIALDLTGADSAGISCFDDKRYDELTWVAVVGKLAGYEGRRFPRRHSMCGVCFATGQPQLFTYPQRYFQWMEQNELIIRQCLLVPVRSPQGFSGTLWVMTHGGEARFGRDDVAILERLAPGLHLL